ncbi:LysR family transcriptional regulator [Acinetobacter sp. ANC 4633]|uniref:LysR substrate-binding domain-containing protein n=1 Tax=Acinetobacter sp. ANC 4633 TaxID=2529845 RepID=UPI00103A655E|nr:LysR substrate-binding domain-containing protein [Acinetobacter sp. ANC 4633]TCB24691.1 LysR family transcriptional regulator [Acinetobacter sp. ANC 4633]
MELRHLRYFITVAEELNFSKAALKLYTAQPSLSQQIKDLEDEIGVKLLNRTKRKVELTEEGAIFLEQARLTIAQAEKAVRLAREAHLSKQQILKIGFITTAEVRVFPKILPNLRMLYPNIKVDLQILNGVDHYRALKKGDLDIIFSRQPFDDPEIANFVVLQDTLALFLAKQHPLATLETIPLQALNDVDLIMSKASAYGIMNQAILAFFKQHNIQPHIEEKTENMVENIAAIEQGMSCSILPQYLDPFIKLDQIAVRPLECELPPLNLFISYRKNNLSFPMQKLLELLHEHFEFKSA